MRKKIPDILIKAAAILVIIAIIYKFIGIIFVKGGYGDHYAGPLGVSPDAFLQFSGLLLVFSIAMNLQRFISGKAAVGKQEEKAEPPAQTSEG